MAIEITPIRKRPVDGAGAIDVSRSQMDGAEGDTFTVANGAVSERISRSGVYRVVALDECRVRAGDTVPNAVGGFRMFAQSVETWFLNAGEVVACDAIA
jgi:hypothetical protein